MTEEQIERRVESMFNALDRRLMSNAVTQADYDAEAKRIDRWAELEYRSMRQPTE